MNGKTSETKPKTVKLTFTCAICGTIVDALPVRGESQLARMQQHAMEKHGITRLQIICARRESPCALTYQWRLQDGRVYLVSTRLVEKQATLKCVHHWIIDHENVGVCKFCKRKRDFGRLLGEDVKITIQRPRNQSKKSQKI